MLITILKHERMKEKKKKQECDLSHSSGETISALNRTSDFKRDFAVIDSVRFSKSSYHAISKNK